MKEEKINKLIKLEDELLELEERAEKYEELTDRAFKSIKYTAIIWSFCSIILLFTTSPLLILAFVVSATPIFVFLTTKLIKVLLNKKFKKQKQKFEFKKQEFQKQYASQKEFEEEMAVYRK